MGIYYTPHTYWSVLQENTAKQTVTAENTQTSEEQNASSGGLIISNTIESCNSLQWFHKLLKAWIFLLTIGSPAPSIVVTPGIEKSAISLFKIIPFFVMIPEPKYSLIVLEEKSAHNNDEVSSTNFRNYCMRWPRDLEALVTRR